MSNEQWVAVDRVFSQYLVHQDEALLSALKESEKAELPAIQVAPQDGKFLNMLARSIGAKRILEIGTLGGYSTIWLARALPDEGRLITLEYEPKHAEVARRNIDRAGVGHKVEIKVGAALDTLPSVAGPFDFIFIDADKTGYPDYLQWSMKLSRPGTIIIADNVIRKGAVIDAKSNDERVQAVRKFNEIVANNPRLTATAIQTVGSKGYDGFTMALVID